MNSVDTPKRPALLWEESFLWGLMTLEALSAIGVRPALLRAEDVRAGALENFGSLIVPGGWASNKLAALGEEGAGRLRDFVDKQGGSYLGFCGGAGLATEQGIGLLPVGRRPGRERVPSLSGRVCLNLGDAEIFKGIDEPLFHIWWPSQFVLKEGPDLRVLARFERATEEAMSSDLPVRDVRLHMNGDWRALEERYGINLDPSRMEGEPMLIEGDMGAGRVILSLVHFDTPGDARGARVLENLAGRLGWLREAASAEAGDSPPSCAEDLFKQSSSGEGLYSAASEPFFFGLRNFLWWRRGPLLQWRRGVRGFEYFTLHRLAAELTRRGYEERDGEFSGELREFSDKACRLLFLERRALDRGERITFSSAGGDGARGDDLEELIRLRAELFSKKKSYGGWFKRLLDALDGRLYGLLNSP